MNSTRRIRPLCRSRIACPLTKSSHPGALPTEAATASQTASLLQTGDASMSDVLDHISLGVADLERSRRFYDAVAGALGFSRLWDTATASSYGLGKGSDDFGITQSAGGTPLAGSHVAL